MEEVVARSGIFILTQYAWGLDSMGMSTPAAPTRPSRRQGLERLLNLATVVGVVFVVFWGAQHWREKHIPPKPGILASRTILRSSDKLDLPIGRANKETFVVALREDCAVCRKQRSFYEMLAQRGATTKKHIGILFVYPPGEMPADLSAIGGSSIAADFAQAKIRVSPTIYLLDGTGHLEGMWSGELTEGEQQRILQAF